MFEKLFGNDLIEFSCVEQDWDVIPKPYAARKFTPDWYKALPMKLNEKEHGCTDHFSNSTLKRCVPFLDAMTAGYIIPLTADVEFVSTENASGVSWFCKYPKPVIAQHGKNQITSSKCPNPMENYPPLKFLNYWYIKTPPGWSTLFVPPLNRQDDRFVCYSGLVDTDKYVNFVNFPFFFTKPNFIGILEAGTPLVQAIPIQRKYLKHKIKPLTKKEEIQIDKMNKRINFQKSIYRDHIVEKK